LSSHNVNVACETTAAEQEGPHKGTNGEKNVEMSTITYSAMGLAQPFFELPHFSAFPGLASAKWGFLDAEKFVVAGDWVTIKNSDDKVLIRHFGRHFKKPNAAKNDYASTNSGRQFIAVAEDKHHMVHLTYASTIVGLVDVMTEHRLHR